MQANQEEAHEESHHLLFENQYGSGQLVSAKDIRQLMQNSPNPIDVIFVAACDSEDIGKTFIRCGVKHVVCVESDKYVLDAAAIKFTQTFYHRIFEGKTVCDAFNTAKGAIKFTKGRGEGNIFKMLKADQP